MAISGRLVLLAAAGLAPVLLFPGWLTVLGVLLLLAALAMLDVLLAAALQQVSVERSAPPNVTLGAAADSVLTVHNSGTRRLRAVVRDAWQPSAGAENPVQEADVPAGERRRLNVRLRPVRRGDLGVPHITVRSFGPLRPPGADHDGGPSRRCAPVDGTHIIAPDIVAQGVELGSGAADLHRGLAVELPQPAQF